MPIIFEAHPAPPTPPHFPQTFQASATFVGASSFSATARLRLTARATLLATTALASSAFVQGPGQAQTLTVGPGKQFATFSAANLAAHDGDTIAVDAGTYLDDFASIIRNITIQSVGGMAIFDADVDTPNDKGIWVTNANVTVMGCEFRNAHGPSNNNNAIRMESGNLTLYACWIHDCQTGILTANGSGILTIDGTEINNCGVGDGQSHNIYAGVMTKLVIQNNSFIHDADTGHNVKSRALETVITGSRIYDNTSPTSYSIDISQGGKATITNNKIHQGTAAANPIMIAYGAEAPTNPNSSLLVTGNTFINDLTGSPVGVQNFLAGVTAQVNSNTYWGLTSGQLVSGTNSQSGNVLGDIQPLLDQRHPWDTSYSSLQSVSEWRGVFHANFNMSPTDGGASWETNIAPYESWLGKKITHVLGFSDTGNWSFNNQAFTVMTNWRGRLATRPGLKLFLRVPMLTSNSEWDALLDGTANGGTSDSKFQSINDSIVLHNNTDAPGSAALIYICIGWESNGSDYPWSHQPNGPTWPSSTYSRAKYRAGWRRIAALFAGARALGAKLVWNPNTPFKSVLWADHWPGNDDAGIAIPGFNLVDVIGMDCYDQWVGGPTVSEASRWNTMYNSTDGQRQLINFAIARGLPVAVPEWGIDLDSGTSPAGKHSGDDDLVVTNMSRVIQSLIDIGKFVGGCYWNSTNNINSRLGPTSTGVLAPAEFLRI